MRLRLVCTAAAFAAATILAPVGTAIAADTPSSDFTPAQDQFTTQYTSMVDGWTAANKGQPVTFNGDGMSGYFDAAGASRATWKNQQGKTATTVCRPPAANKTTTCFTIVKGAKKWTKTTSPSIDKNHVGVAAQMIGLGMIGGMVAAADDAKVTSTVNGDTTTLTVTGTSSGGTLTTFTFTSSPTSFIAHGKAVDNGQTSYDNDIATVKRVPAQKKIVFPPKRLVA